MTSHTVLAGGGGEGFASLTRAGTPRTERYRIGRSLRESAPRRSLGRWSAALRREDAVEIVAASNEGRVPGLVNERLARMSASPYAYLRGAAAMHAADFAVMPSTGIHPVICGDAHLGNFGFYASPERDLVFDLNDFDEAHPGAWEWDLRRLVASTWVAGRENDATESQCEQAVARCVTAYRKNVARLAEAPLLARSYEHLEADDMEDRSKGRSRRAVAAAADRARTRTSDRALPRFVTEEDGKRRIVVESPEITRPDEATHTAILSSLDGYLETLPRHWARVLGGYHAVDVAHKVVGVGSVGLRAYLVLCEGSSPDDVLFLQLKQARRSVVAHYVHGQEALHSHQGQRVVEYQQALQTVSDPLLGWTTVEDREGSAAGGAEGVGTTQYYVRQFRDMKGAIVLDDLDGAALTDYAAVCGMLLAKGHARTSGASMIAGYLGGGGRVRDALCRFAREYADQTEADHARFVRAVRSGRLSGGPPAPV